MSDPGVLPKNLARPKPPAAPPPERAPVQKIVVAYESGQETETESVHAQLARMQNDIERLREQLARANARIAELQKRSAPR